jgi:hypothetical protein
MEFASIGDLLFIYFCKTPAQARRAFPDRMMERPARTSPGTAMPMRPEAWKR